MDLREDVFHESYELTYNRLTSLSKLEGFDISLFEGELEHLMRYEEQDWAGRGEIKNSEISGQVMAYQVFIRRWKRGSQPEDI